MERRVNMVVCWQLQFISDRVDMFYNLELGLSLLQGRHSWIYQVKNQTSCPGW